VNSDGVWLNDSPLSAIEREHASQPRRWRMIEQEERNDKVRAVFAQV